MHLCDIHPEDEVILPTISFVGAGNAVCADGSKMVLCDVDKRTLNTRAEDIEKVITPKTKPFCCSILVEFPVIWTASCLWRMRTI